MPNAKKSEVRYLERRAVALHLAGKNFDDIAEEVGFASRLNWQAGFLDEFTRMWLSSLKLNSGTRCLEVGPGAGTLTHWVADQGWSVQALDISDRYFPGIAHEGVELRVGDVREIGVDEEFDLVFPR